MKQQLPPEKVSRHFPVSYREALQRAAQNHNDAEINNITDELVAKGLCRPRNDKSMFDKVKS